MTTKNALERTLNKLIYDRFVNERQAADIAASILHDNARRLYVLEDLL
jgi:hypothetical protein